MVDLCRFALFDFNVRVERGRIVTSVAYHKDMHHQQRILEWIDKYEATLIQMANELIGISPDCDSSGK